MKMGIKCRCVLQIVFLIYTFLHVFSGDSAAQLPDSLEGKIDMLGGSVAENELSKKYFIKLGPDAVPIVARKLLESLAEGASAEAARETIIMKMPPADQNRVRHQAGLIAMQGVALENMPLGSDVKKIALDSLYKALQSPYAHSRKVGLYSVTYGGGSEVVDYILPLLGDPVKSNRVIAAQMLAKIGDASTADKIEKALEQRRRGLTEEQVDSDWSFRHGYETIKTLREKEASKPIQAPPQAIAKQSSAPPLTPEPPPLAEAGSQSPLPPVQTLTPKPVATPVAAKVTTRFPIVPVISLAALIMVVIVFLVRRKGS